MTPTRPPPSHPPTHARADQEAPRRAVGGETRPIWCHSGRGAPGALCHANGALCWHRAPRRGGEQPRAVASRRLIPLIRGRKPGPRAQTRPPEAQGPWSGRRGSPARPGSRAPALQPALGIRGAAPVGGAPRRARAGVRAGVCALLAFAPSRLHARALPSPSAPCTLARGARVGEAAEPRVQPGLQMRREPGGTGSGPEGSGPGWQRRRLPELFWGRGRAVAGISAANRAISLMRKREEK